MTISKSAVVTVLIFCLTGSPGLASGEDELAQVLTVGNNASSAATGGVTFDNEGGIDAIYRRPALLGMIHSWSFSTQLAGLHRGRRNLYFGITPAIPLWPMGGYVAAGYHFGRVDRVRVKDFPNRRITDVTIHETAVGYGAEIHDGLYAGVGFSDRRLTRLDPAAGDSWLWSPQMRMGVHVLREHWSYGLNYQHTFEADQIGITSQLLTSDVVHLYGSFKLARLDSTYVVDTATQDSSLKVIRNRWLTVGLEGAVAKDISDELRFGGEVGSKLFGPVSGALRAGYVMGNGLRGSGTMGAGLSAELAGVNIGLDYAYSKDDLGSDDFEHRVQLNLRALSPWERIKKVLGAGRDTVQVTLFDTITVQVLQIDTLTVIQTDTLFADGVDTLTVTVETIRTDTLYVDTLMIVDTLEVDTVIVTDAAGYDPDAICQLKDLVEFIHKKGAVEQWRFTQDIFDALQTYIPDTSAFSDQLEAIKVNGLVKANGTLVVALSCLESGDDVGALACTIKALMCWVEVSQRDQALKFIDSLYVKVQHCD